MVKKLFESVFLIEVRQPDIINLEAMHPQDHELSDEMLYLSSATTPLIPLPETSFVYTFNMKQLYCHTIYFFQSGVSYEIIIFSATSYCKIFREFLDQALHHFKEKIATARERYQYVLDYLLKWKNEIDSEKITLQFPNGDVEFTLPDERCFEGYNPSKYFNLQQVKDIWRALLADEPILIVAPDAEVGSYACLSALSLSKPIEYKGSFILWLRETDPRFIDLVNNKSEVKIVASSNPNLSNLNYFKVIINVDKVRDDSAASKYAYTELPDRMADILSVCVSVMDHYLNYNPWADLLNDPLKQKVVKSYRKLLTKPSISVDDYLKFSRSKTFEYFRYRNLNRDTWREAILSGDPNCLTKIQNPEDLLKIISYSKEQKKKYVNDKHVFSVLNQHLKIASQRYHELTGSDPKL
ncbi:hypothetical protein TVAG_426620 [Trichomonas vaginalis G3]|uniref:UDENN domain-containing protein n=1 Tax=Trichomonas vaginalis (strain ATCC PRA-98 / G3) TaxID=412133 RepID=A2DYS8_TRIV3|nr:UDENN domain family [Trichomonas vaginalis G3]EAY14468.1 hypothetical protein TVAG_426620 [Trichomonas vaginalis G3]KAI5519648.1 UDENN domain family [Trichomonas vaginalis G3]|eukprot:XP_001326691.1 hypothetical protein [Trichomonas vaginalis G3]